MYMKSLIPVTAALLLLAACGQRNASRQTAPAAAQTAVPDMHDAENALDYQGHLYRRLSGRRCTGHRRHADARPRRTLHRGETATANAPASSPTTDAHRPREHTHPAPRFAERHPRLLPGRRKTGSGGSTATSSPLRDRSPTSTSSPNRIRQLPQAATDAPADTIHPSGTGSLRRPPTDGPGTAAAAPTGEIKKPPARVSCRRSSETAPKRR